MINLSDHLLFEFFLCCANQNVPGNFAFEVSLTGACLRDDAGEAALELVDLAAEGVEVVVKLLGVNVHDVVLGVNEDLDGRQEVRVRLADGGGKDLALGPTNLHPFVASELGKETNIGS
jgi:hypothetical protein